MTKQIKWALDVLTCGAWWDCIPDDSSDIELLLLESAVKEMAGIASRLTYCGECVYFNRITDTLGTCERCTEGIKTEDDFCSSGDAGEGEKMKKHPNDEPVPLHTALWAAEAWNRRDI